MSLTQKALIVTEIGKPLTLVNDWPIPQPGAGQVQLKVTVAGLNPHDQKSRDWGLVIIRDHMPVFHDKPGFVDLPFIPTNDITGTVTKLGPGVTEFAVGDRIVSQGSFAIGSLQKGLQEYAIADITASAKVPGSITDDEAATLPTNLITSFVAIFNELRIPVPWSAAAKTFDCANTSILIIGGGTNCGQFGVQLARLANIGCIVVVGGDEARLKSFGATHIIDRHATDETIITKIRDIVGDDLVYAYDTINPVEKQVLGLNALSSHKKGTLARLIPRGPVDGSKVLGKQAGFEVRDLFGSAHIHPELTAGLWSRLPGYLEGGQIKPLGYVVKEGLSAETVNDVMDDYRDGKRVTKTHIHL